MLSRFHLIPERYGRSDGQTDGQICYINIARQYADINDFMALMGLRAWTKYQTTINRNMPTTSLWLVENVCNTLTQVYDKLIPWNANLSKKIWRRQKSTLSRHCRVLWSTVHTLNAELYRYVNEMRIRYRPTQTLFVTQAEIYQHK